MAILPVTKVHIIAHKDVKEQLLHDLQKAGIIHITELEERSSQVPQKLTNVNDALNQLSSYKKRGILEMFLPMRRPVSLDAFEHAKDHSHTAQELASIKTERETMLNELHRVKDMINLLSPWAPFSEDLRVLREFNKTDSVPCIVPTEDVFNSLQELLQDIPHSYEIIHTIGPAIYCIFFIEKETCTLLRSRLIENECEIVDLMDFTGIPADIIVQLKVEVKKIEERLMHLDEREQTLAAEIDNLELSSDHIANQYHKKNITAALPETIQTTNIIGWVQKRHMKQLAALLDKVEFAAYEEVAPEQKEQPPIAIKNPAWTRPYEMLIKLYSMPDQKEFDPTPLLAIFFPIMFGMCLTDVVYGIILMLFSLYLIRKVVGDRSLMWILFGGGICTMFAGAMVGGWASDLFVKIGWDPLIQLRSKFMLFDPLSKPLLFIGIALGVGFIHMLVGILIEIIDCFKNKQPGQAIFANLTWFIFLPSVLLYFILLQDSVLGKALCEIVLWSCIIGIIVASSPEGNAKTIDQLVWAIIIFLIWVPLTEPLLHIIFKITYQISIPGYVYYAIIPLLAFELFRFRQSKGVLGKIAWGFYNLYGISSYLSVILSYVRLMALGLVTGVIGMAINTIAWMLVEIPVIGIILMILILIGGHLFNIAVNVLGGFIHTMRLQYIEFFGRFYAGGSKPFQPFKFETKYVQIK